MGDDRDMWLMNNREAVWPVVKQLDLAQSGCLRQRDVCHSRARCMKQTNVASVRLCSIQASRLALTVTVTVSASHALRNQNSMSHTEGFSWYISKLSPWSNSAVRIYVESNCCTVNINVFFPQMTVKHHEH